jgi:D-xylulose kinase
MAAHEPDDAHGSATRAAFLGIDCGTGSTKALLIDASSGAVLGIGRAPHDLVERLDGTREQDPAWWIAALRSAVREVVAAVPGVEVKGIGVSGQQHGLVALDDHDRPVRPAKLWNDTTTAAECDALTRALGDPHEVLAAIGNLFLPGYTAPKIAWLRSHEPDAYAASRRFCLPHDYLNLWLTGAFVTEPGDASGTAYVDVRDRAYSRPVLDALDPQRDWDASLPPIVPSLSVIGELRADVAAQLGLRPGTPVSGGGGDNMCAAIGVGAVESGRVVVSLGTSGTIFARSDTVAVDPRGEAAAFCDSTGGWLPLACTLNCTNATDWVRELTGLDRDGFEAALRDTPAGAGGLTFLPYLDGERTPNLPAAAAAFHGMRTEHGPGHLARAVAEGVTLGLVYAREALERAGVGRGEVTLVGGGAASDAWGQLCADALGVAVHRAPDVEAAALGAARQAAAVVDRVPLPGPAAAAMTWEPRQLDGLAAAQSRLAELRALAGGAR